MLSIAFFFAWLRWYGTVSEHAKEPVSPKTDGLSAVLV
jgi:hypothetical protein